MPSRVLIVTPASLRLNWRAEWRKWHTGRLRPHLLDEWPGGLFDDTAGKALIVSYDSVRKWHPQIAAVEWDVLIADEIHLCKDDTTRRAKTIFGGKYQGQTFEPIQARRKLFLSGTPIVNKPAELWPLVKALAPDGLGKSRVDFLTRYGAGNLDELHLRLRSQIMVRRLKENVLKQLPKKRRQVVLLDVAGAGSLLQKERDVISLQQEALERTRREIEGLSHAEQVARLRQCRAIALSEIARVRHETALAKLPAAIEHIHDILANVEKAVVFSHHHDVFDGLCGEFRRIAVGLDGRTDQSERQNAVDMFQRDRRVRLFIGGLKAAGLGITLTAASVVVFVELDWTPAAMMQAEDRCVLAGQPVLTSRGWVPIEQVRQGDLVIAEDGQPHAVIDTHSRKAKGAYAADTKTIAEIEVRGWPDAIKVTDDHLVLLAEGQWVMAGDLKPGMCLAMPRPVVGFGLPAVEVDDQCRFAPEFTTPAIVRSDGKPKRETTQKNARLVRLPWSIPIDDEAMFVFGYYMGDGFASTRTGKGRFVSFSGHDKQKVTHLRRCAEWVERFQVNHTIYKGSASEHGVELRCFSGELANWFAQQFGRVLLEKSVPQWVYSASLPQRRAFIDGVMASDGYLRRARHEIVTASWRLAADFTRLVMSVGFKACLTRGSGAWFVVAWTPAVAQDLVVTRVTLRLPDKIERVYDLTVADVHSFVVGTAVVHNCHRIGQVNPVLVQHLVIDGSIDQKMAAILIDKQAMMDAALDGGRPEAASRDILTEVMRA